jgi:hypothetical protein
MCHPSSENSHSLRRAIARATVAPITVGCPTVVPVLKNVPLRAASFVTASRRSPSLTML